MQETNRDDVQRLLDVLDGANYTHAQADSGDVIRSMCEELLALSDIRAEIKDDIETVFELMPEEGELDGVIRSLNALVKEKPNKVDILESLKICVEELSDKNQAFTNALGFAAERVGKYP